MILHNTLSGIQGGITDEYYHLTNEQIESLAAGGICCCHAHNHCTMSGLSEGNDHPQYVLHLYGQGNLIAGLYAGEALPDEGGLYNVLIGMQAGRNLINGDENVCIGWRAGLELTTGDRNTFIGVDAGRNGTVAEENVCIGFMAGNDLSAATSVRNMLLGYEAGKNTKGTSNVAVGATALRDNVNGIYNLAIGRESLVAPESPDKCVGVGSGAMMNAGNDIEYNTAIGFRALRYTDGNYNTAIGRYAGYGSNTQSDGDYNTFIGHKAGFSITTGDSNVCIGNEAGCSLTTDSNELWIDNSDDANNPLIYGQFGTSSTNKVAINTSAPVTDGPGLTVMGDVFPKVDDTYDLGGSSFRWDDIYATNNIIQTSDGRLKDEVKDIQLGLDFINQLHPVQYKWKDYEVETSIKVPIYEVRESGPDSDGNTEEEKVFVGFDTVITKEPKTFRRKHQGLISQEVRKVMDRNNISTNDFAGYIYDKKLDNYGLRYEEFIAPIIKAVQELSAENKELRKEVDELKNRRR